MTDFKRHPLIIFEKARKLIGHKTLVPATHHRTLARQFDSGAGPSSILMSYAAVIKVEKADLIERGETSAVALTLPTVDVANNRIETDVCCIDCRMFLELVIDVPKSRMGLSPWSFSLLGAHDCGCYHDSHIDQELKDELEKIHDQLTELEEDQQ